MYIIVLYMNSTVVKHYVESGGTNAKQSHVPTLPGMVLISQQQ